MSSDATTDVTPAPAPQTPPDPPDEGLRPAVWAVARQWKLVIPVFLLLAALGGWYAMNLPVKYAAGSVLSFLPREGSANGKDLAALLVERYPEVATSTEALAAAGSAAGVSPGTVHSGLTANVQPSTLNLMLSVELPSNDQAVAAVTAINRQVVTSSETDPNLRAVQISPPSPWGPTGTSKKLVLAGSVVLAAVVAFVVGLVADGLRRTSGPGEESDQRTSKQPGRRRRFSRNRG